MQNDSVSFVYEVKGTLYQNFTLLFYSTGDIVACGIMYFGTGIDKQTVGTWSWRTDINFLDIVMRNSFMQRLVDSDTMQDIRDGYVEMLAREVVT